MRRPLREKEHSGLHSYAGSDGSESDYNVYLRGKSKCKQNKEKWLQPDWPLWP
jgi:hypothetical protein